MKVGPSESVLASAASWQAGAASWLGARLLADDLPILSGRVTTTTSSNVPDMLKCSIARHIVVGGRTVDLLPASPDAALARYGQQLDVRLQVAGVGARIGRFQIQDWDYTEDSIEISAPGLLQIPADARLLEPTAPRDGGTFMSEFRRLLPSGMTVAFQSGLVDRPVPRTMQWDEDRLEALYEIADAWPAVIRMDQWGGLVVKPPPQTEGVTPVVTLKDGVGGTVVRVPRKDTRKGAANIMVVRSSADGVVASGVAQQTSGPYAVATYNPVPQFYASPLLTTNAQCLAVARAKLPEAMRQSSILAVEMAPDPRLELDDVVRVVRDGQKDTGMIVGLDIPLTIGDGMMRVDVGVL